MVLPIPEVRKKFPQYSELNDHDFVSKIREEFYPKWDDREFKRMVGLQLDPTGERPEPRPEGMAPPAPPAPTPDTVALPPDPSTPNPMGDIAALLAGTAPPVRPPVAPPMAPTPWTPNAPPAPPSFDTQLPITGLQARTPDPDALPETPFGMMGGISFPGMTTATLPVGERPDRPSLKPGPEPEAPPDIDKAPEPPVPETPINPNGVVAAPNLNDPGFLPMPPSGDAPAPEGEQPAADPGVAALDEIGEDNLTEFGKGLRTGWTGLKQMTTALGTIPLGGTEVFNLELLGHVDAVDALPAGMDVWQLAKNLNLNTANARHRVLLDLAWQYYETPEEERGGAREQISAATLKNREQLQSLVDSVLAFQEEMKKFSGKTANFTDIKDVNSFREWFAFNTGQILPYSAAAAAGGLVGGMPGVIASGYGMGVGDIQSGLVEKGETGRGDVALLGGAPYAGLEALGPVARMFRGVSGRTLENVAQSYFKRLGKEIPKSAVEEFINEAGQEIIKDIAVSGGTGEPLVINDEKLLAWFNSGMAGMVGGTVMAPATVPLTQKPDQPVPDATPAPPPQQTPALPPQQEAPAAPTPDAAPAPSTAPPPPLQLEPEQRVPDQPPAPEQTPEVQPEQPLPESSPSGEARPAPVESVSDEGTTGERDRPPESSAQGGEIDLDTEGGRFEFYPETESGQNTGRYIRVDMETGDMDIVGNAKPANPPAQPTPETSAEADPPPQPEQPAQVATPDPKPAPTPQPSAVKRRRKPDQRPQRRPFTNIIKKYGIDPDSVVAKDLVAMGVTARTTPGLFRKGGLKEVDNLPADEWQEFRYEVGEEGPYLSRQGVIDAIVTEANGTPMRWSDRDYFDRQKKDNDDRFRAEHRAFEAQPDELAVDDPYIADRDQDISTDAERQQHIGRSVDVALDAAGMRGAFSARERQSIIDRLDQFGGYIHAAIDAEIRDGIDDIETQYRDGDVEGIPWEDPNSEADGDQRQPSEGDPGRSEGERRGEGRSPAADEAVESPAQRTDAQEEGVTPRSPEDQALIEEIQRNNARRNTERAGAVTEETEAGEQSVIPGAEKDKARSSEARAADEKREVDVRAKQSRIGTTVQQKDAGPLFNDETDLFDNRSDPLALGPKPQHQATSGSYAISQDVAKAAFPRLRAELDRLGLKSVRLKMDGLYANRQGAFMADGFGAMDILIGNTANPDNTLYHESIHAMRHLELFTDAEWQSLSQAAVTEWIEKYDIADRYPHLIVDEQIEEAIAEAFADFATSKTTPSDSAVRRAMSKIKRVIDAIRKAFKGMSTDQIFDEAFSGAIGLRGPENSGVIRWLDATVNDQANATRSWQNALYQVFNNSQYRRDVPLGGMPIVLRAVGAPRKPLIMAASKIRKVNLKHLETKSSVIRLPELLANPLAIIQQNRDDSDVRVVLDQWAEEGPIVANVSFSEKSQRGQDVGVVMTVHPWGAFEAGIVQAEKTQNLLYMRDSSARAALGLKRDDPSTASVPSEAAGGKSNVLSRDDVVKKYGKSKEQRNFVPPEKKAKKLSRKDRKRQKGQSFSNAAIDKIHRLNEQYRPAGMSKQDELEIPPAFNMPQRRGLTRVRESWQDQFIMSQSIEDAIGRDTGTRSPDAISFRLKQTLFEGRSSERVEQAQNNEFLPLQKLMTKLKVSLDDLGIYLIAKHAKERNAIMAKRNPDRFKNGGGSGMFDETADELLAEYDATGKTANLEKAARAVREILNRDLKQRVEAGLISKEQAKEYATMYKNYVPLQGVAEREDGGQMGRIGKGFDVRGKDVKSAVGRMSISENPVVQAIMMRREGIVRAEKNRVTKSLFAMAQKYPNPEVWEIVGKLPQKEYLDKETGQVKKMTDFGAINEDEVVGVKVSGDVQYMRLKDPVLLAATKNLGGTMVGPWARFVTALMRVTKSLSRWNTGGNPNFVFPNGQSDFLEGVWTAYNIPKKNVAKAMSLYMANYPLVLAYSVRSTFINDSRLGRGLTGAMKKRMKKLTGEDLTEEKIGKLEQYRREWQEDGGRINFMAFRDMEEISREIQTEIEKTDRRFWQIKPWQVVENMTKVVETINQPVEMAGRLAMYMTARQLGLSREQSAALALDSAGNYYRRGSMTRGAAAFYAFFNPAVQGIEKFARFATKPRNIAVMSALPVTSYILTEYMMFAYDDDDDPEGKPLYMDIPEHERNRSIIIPRGTETVTITKEDGTTEERTRLKYWSWRIPHNLRPLWALGAQVALARHKHVDAAKATATVGRSMLMNTNPLGSESLLNMAAPTVSDPFADIAQNRNFSGSPIHPDSQWSRGLPNSTQYYPSTPDWMVGMVQSLNSWTGGDAFTPGAVDVYPDDIDHIVRFMTGGLGRFITDSVRVGLDKADGAEVKVGEVPIVRYSASETGNFAANGYFYEVRNKFNEDANRLRNAYKVATDESQSDEDRAYADNVYKTLMVKYGVRFRTSGDRITGFDWKQSPKGYFDDADSRLKDLREEIDLVQNNDTLGRAQKKTEVERLRHQMELIQDEARRLYLNKMAEIGAALGPDE